MIVAGMRFNRSVCAAKMATMAATVGAAEATADGFIAWLEAFRAGIGIPSSLRAVGVTEAQMDALIASALADVCHTFNPRQPVTAEDFRRLFEEALA
jgi:alcohol dehydrogenase class IV